MTTHRISSNGFDGQQSAVKAKELRLQQQRQWRQGERVDRGKEGRREGPHIRDGGKHEHVWRFEDDKRQKYDTSDFSGVLDRYSQNKDYGGYSGYGGYAGMSFTYEYTKITVTASRAFSGSYDSAEDAHKAHTEFAEAALDFIKNPSEASYKRLNEAMAGMLDGRFAPAHVGGNAQVSVLSYQNTTMAKFTMEITPAPTKSLEEARADLHKNYNEETYTNYIRALSEKFKAEGKITHTNDTPTTPVYKSSVIYASKTEKGGLGDFREIKRPEYEHNFFGRHRVKNKSLSFLRDFGGHNSFWQKLGRNAKATRVNHR